MEWCIITHSIINVQHFNSQHSRVTREEQFHDISNSLAFSIAKNSFHVKTCWGDLKGKRWIVSPFVFLLCLFPYLNCNDTENPLVHFACCQLSVDMLDWSSCLPIISCFSRKYVHRVLLCQQLLDFFVVSLWHDKVRSSTYIMIFTNTCIHFIRSSNKVEINKQI